MYFRKRFLKWFISILTVVYICFFSFLSAPAEYIYASELPDGMHSDFSDLYHINENIAGWLMAGDSISEPVLQLDNDFYLHHDIYDQDSEAGTLFVNEFSTLSPMDDVVMIHGHNMRSGSMFGTLLRFNDFDYVRKHPILSFRTIYDAQDVYYTPAAAFYLTLDEKSDDYFNLMWIYLDKEDFLREIVDESKEEKEQESEFEEYKEIYTSTPHKERLVIYEDSILSRSVWNSPAGMGADDQLLLLVTCSYNQAEERFALVCRKLREEETTDQILALFQNSEDN